MTNMDPQSTQGIDGGAVDQTGGGDTIGGVQSEFEFGGRDHDLDGNGDGVTQIETEPQTLEEILEDEQAKADLAQQQAEAAAEQRAAKEAAEEAEAAAREQAAETGEAVHMGSSTHDGEPVEVFAMPDGSTVMVSFENSESGEVVSVAFPSDPVFLGYITVIGDDGEPTSTQLFELYDGTQVVIDDGEMVGTIDDVELATIDTDLFPPTYLPPDVTDGVDEVYLMPMGPPSYDTEIVDAATGEPIHELQTGVDMNAPGMEDSGLTSYTPPGADYAMVIDDETGEVVNAYPLPEEPEFSFLGIIEVYEDGTVSIDLAIIEVDVDLIGPEKGVSVGVDLFFIQVGAGFEWDSDGNWNFDAYLDVDMGTFEWGGSMEMSWEDGEFSAAMDAYVGVQLGTFEAMAEAGVDLTIGPDGTEVGLSAGASARGSLLGVEVDVELEGGVDIGPGGIQGSFSAEGTFQTDHFGGIEGGVSFDSDEGWDSYLETGDGGGRSEDHGLDMGWTEDTADGTDFERPDDDAGPGARDGIDRDDARRLVADGETRAGRARGDEADQLDESGVRIGDVATAAGARRFGDDDADQRGDGDEGGEPDPTNPVIGDERIGGGARRSDDTRLDEAAGDVESTDGVDLADVRDRTPVRDVFDDVVDDVVEVTATATHDPDATSEQPAGVRGEPVVGDRLGEQGDTAAATAVGPSARGADTEVVFEPNGERATDASVPTDRTAEAVTPLDDPITAAPEVTPPAVVAPDPSGGAPDSVLATPEPAAEAPRAPDLGARATGADTARPVDAAPAAPPVDTPPAPEPVVVAPEPVVDVDPAPIEPPPPPPPEPEPIVAGEPDLDPLDGSA